MNGRSGMKAVILAAGKGTRMKSGLAKVLHEANGKPLAYYPIRRALDLSPPRLDLVPDAVGLGDPPGVVLVGLGEADDIRILDFQRRRRCRARDPGSLAHAVEGGEAEPGDHDRGRGVLEIPSAHAHHCIGTEHPTCPADDT